MGVKNGVPPVKITAWLLRHNTLKIQSATYHTGKIRARRVPYKIRCLILSVEEKTKGDLICRIFLWKAC